MKIGIEQTIMVPDGYSIKVKRIQNIEIEFAIDGKYNYGIQAKIDKGFVYWEAYTNDFNGGRMRWSVGKNEWGEPTFKSTDYEGLYHDMIEKLTSMSRDKLAADRLSEGEATKRLRLLDEAAKVLDSFGGR